MARENTKYERFIPKYVPGVGILWDQGATVPANGSAGYAKGAIFQHIDGAAATCFYINVGTLASSSFGAASSAAAAALEAALVSALTPGGASKVGVFDTAGYWSAATVEAILAELGALRYGAGGSAAGRGPSPLIWSTCPVLDYMVNPTLGMHYFEDFQSVALALAAAQGATLLDQGIMGTTAATGATIAQSADDPYGVVELLGTTDDMDTAIMMLGGINTAGSFIITAAKKFWFEARLKMTNIDNDTAGVFVGFMEQGLLATTSMIAAAGTLADKDYLGFHRLEADGDKFDTVYNKAGAEGPHDVAADAVTLVANTYKKVGMYCDGTTIYFYADGVLLTDSVALANAQFTLEGEELALYIVQMLAATAAHNVFVDWVRVAREY